MIIITLALIEMLTSVGAFFGFRVAAARQQLRGINKPISLPFLDKHLSKQMGNPTRAQRFRAKQIMRAFKFALRFRAAEILLLAALNKKSPLRNKAERRIA